MIVGKQKSLEEIWGMVKDYKKVLVFGCNTCVAICHEGGNKEAEILGALLRMKAKQENRDMEIEPEASSASVSTNILIRRRRQLKRRT